jgi:hypothetical protein
MKKFKENVNKVKKAELLRGRYKEEGEEGQSGKKKPKKEKKSHVLDDYGDEGGEVNERSDDDDVAQQDFSHESEESLG